MSLQRDKQTYRTVWRAVMFPSFLLAKRTNGHT